MAMSDSLTRPTETVFSQVYQQTRSYLRYYSGVAYNRHAESQCTHYNSDYHSESAWLAWCENPLEGFNKSEWNYDFCTFPNCLWNALQMGLGL